MLKWLRLPRTTCPTMIAISNTLAATTTVPAHQPVRCRRVSSECIQARVSPYSTNETENLRGLCQIGDPASIRSSTSSPTPETRVITPMAAAKTSSGRCHPAMWIRILRFPRNG